MIGSGEGGGGGRGRERESSSTRFYPGHHSESVSRQSLCHRVVTRRK